jgi:hypothetical protein
MPTLQDLGQFGSDMAGYMPDALKGSVSGTMGLPMDIYQLLRMMGSGNYNQPSQPMPGTSNWFGQQMGANTQSPAFGIAQATAMAPPMAGLAGKAAGMGEKALQAGSHAVDPRLLTMGIQTLQNQAQSYRSIGKIAEANAALRQAQQLQQLIR